MVLSKSALVAPILTATAKPCSISSEPRPCMCKPTTCRTDADAGLKIQLLVCQQNKTCMRNFCFGGLRSDHRHRRSLENTRLAYLLLLADTHQLHDAQALPGGDGVIHRSERGLVDLHILLSPRFVGLLCEEGTSFCNLDSCARCYSIFSINYASNYVCQMKQYRAFNFCKVPGCPKTHCFFFVVHNPLRGAEGHHKGSHQAMCLDHI